MIRKSLSGTVDSVAQLSDIDRDSMFCLLQQYFDGYERQGFDRDLEEKDGVVILRDSKQEVKGFTTYQLLETTVQCEPTRAVFSGDTIVDKDYWGQSELSLVWTRHMLSEAKKAESPLYWFLICSGYKTYRFLPTFFHEFFPRHNRAFPEHEKLVMEAFARIKFPDEYDPETGLITFKHSEERLKKGVADVSDTRTRNPHIQYFLGKNPNHHLGVELACIARLSLDNYRSRALKTIGYCDGNEE